MKTQLLECLSIRNAPVWALPAKIRTMAHALSGRRFACEFVKWFLPKYMRGRGRQNVAALVFTAAQFLINIYGDVWVKQGQTPKNSQRKKEVSGTHIMDKSWHYLC